MRSRGHSEAGGAVARSFLERLTNQQDLIKGVVSLVVDHMRPGDLHSSNAGDAAIRRLAVRVGRIDRLVRTARADREGSCRGDPADFPAGDWLLERARELEIRDSAPKPIVMGRHLLAMGMKPGPIFKRIIDACYEAQIEGAVTTLDEGLALAGRLAAENSTAAASGTGQPGAPVNTTGPR